MSILPIDWFKLLGLSITVIILSIFAMLFIKICYDDRIHHSADEFLKTVSFIFVVIFILLFFPTLSTVVLILSIISCLCSLVIQEWVSWLFSYYYLGNDVYNANKTEKFLHFFPLFISFICFLCAFDWQALEELKNGNFSKLDSLSKLNFDTSVNTVKDIFFDTMKDTTSKLTEDAIQKILQIKKSLWFGIGCSSFITFISCSLKSMID